MQVAYASGITCIIWSIHKGDWVAEVQLLLPFSIKFKVPSLDWSPSVTPTEQVDEP